MTSSPKQKRKSTVPPIARIWAECGSLKKKLDDTRATVSKLKDILQVQDNWHSRVSKWIGQTVLLSVSQDDHPQTCKLLWTDRYNIGVELAGKERLYNKGHVVWIGPK